MLTSTAKRIVVSVVGGTLVLIGVALFVLPGPGLLVVFAGLAILATEYLWARLLLRRVKRTSRNMVDKVRGRSHAKRGGDHMGGAVHETRP